MSLPKVPAAMLFAAGCLPLAFAQAQLPELRIEPTGGGSFFYIKNTSPQPLTAYLIELVDYPGSSYSMWQDNAAGEPLAPGAEKTIRVANMTVGAVPDYVKMRAAIYADGTTAGIPAKVAQLVGRRKFVFETAHELIRRIEGAGDKQALIAELKQWSTSLEPQGKPNRNSQTFINQEAGRGLIGQTIANLETSTPQDVLAALKTAEKALAASKPALQQWSSSRP